ncbi:MAG TPA: sigma-70 family RNA polymerase sigma factor [Steroidobacteraceae bacterium]
MTPGLPRGELRAAAETVVAALAIAGDDAAYAELVRRRHSQIRGLLRHLCRDPSLADDLAQQTFLQAWRRIRSIESVGAFGGWLRKIAVNVWLQHARTRSARAGLSAAPADEPDYSEPSHEPTIGEQLDLDRALAQLPADVRLCIALSYGERLSHREIAAATDIPLGTVKSHIARGSARLRELLGAYQ